MIKTVDIQLRTPTLKFYTLLSQNQFIVQKIQKLEMNPHTKKRILEKEIRFKRLSVGERTKGKRRKGFHDRGEEGLLL
jgi:hypothetical protein